jgi:acyl-CoA hydrolase
MGMGGRASGSADEAVEQIQSGMRVFLHGAAATPSPLVEALCRRSDLRDVTLYHLHTEGAAPFAAPEMQGRFRSVSLFTGPQLRRPVEEGRADFVPILLSQIPRLFRSGRVPLDVALVQLSPPDSHGLLTLGTSVDAARAAVDSARLVIAEVNARMPRTHGNTVVRKQRLDAWVETDRPLPSHPVESESEVEGRIGELVAELVEDGATLQVGIGAIPNAVLRRLGAKRRLGLHTEMFSDGVIELLESGVVTNEDKMVHPGRSVTSFVSGSERLYDFVHDNPLVEFHGCDRTNDGALIRANPKVVAINSALEVDLSGQVCADSIGTRIYSGIGGQLDFITAAGSVESGRAIIALPSTAAGGSVSRIVPLLKPGAGVVTTRGHVHWVVTEHGAVDLFGLTLRQRGEALVSIAHPDHRAQLRRELAALRHFDLGG